MDYQSGRIIESILRDFTLHIRHTFGDLVDYIGTTTNIDASPNSIIDIDIIVVLKQLHESHVTYLWRIIRKLYSKYNIILDVRLYSKNQLPELPKVNSYLLNKFLIDLHNTNPFKYFSISKENLYDECVKRIKEQEKVIINLLPRIANDQNQLRKVSQSVYDAIRAYLLLVGTPIADKESSCDVLINEFPEFSEAKFIYNAYLNPNTVINVASFIIDSLALVKHLHYRTQKRELANQVLLINTPSTILPHPRDDYLKFDNNMPLGIVCIASFLNDKGIETKILDSYAENLGVLETIDRIYINRKIPKIIGLNTCSPNIHIVHKIAKYIKRISKDVIIICGGAHATLAKEHTLSTGDIDYIVSGEGELSSYQLSLEIFGDSQKEIKIPGIFYKHENKILGIEKNETIDLELLPLHNFSLLPIERYFSVKKRLYIHSSRGCAFNCIYCSVPKCFGKKVSLISINTLVKHIIELKKKYQPEEFQIVDDNFSHKKGKIIEEFCDCLINDGIKIKWKCQARADQLNKNIIDKMAEAGCFEIDMGIETGNVEIQKYIRKNLDLERSKQIVLWISKCHIYSKAFIMLGFPNESLKQIEETINYSISLKENGLNDVAFFPVMPFPGTELSNMTGKTVFQGAIIDDFEIHERSFSSQRLKKYSAKPEISLNSLFTPDSLRLMVKFAYNCFNRGSRVINIEEEYNAFLNLEEGGLYAI
ncbi:MAG: B12-binding domain-containing radical SAM protein [Desulfobacterales bacterium]|nr:B12-binding domain-containing radical SAM protein [Desulfobacterales bacterium]